MVLKRNAAHIDEERDEVIVNLHERIETDEERWVKLAKPFSTTNNDTAEYMNKNYKAAKTSRGNY